MGIPERKIKEKEKRKKAILDASKKVFFKNGYNNTTIDMIAKSAQLSKGTIYLYFKSKDSIFLHLIYDGLVILKKIIHEASKVSLNLDKKLIHIAREYYNYSEKYSDYFKINFNKENIIYNNNSLLNEEIVTNINNIEKEIFLIIYNEIENTINTELFINEINSNYSVIKLWASINGAIYTLKNNRNLVKFLEIEPINIIEDIVKTFIISYSNSQELINHYRKDILENASKLCKLNINNKGDL